MEVYGRRCDRRSSGWLPSQCPVKKLPMSPFGDAAKDPNGLGDFANASPSIFSMGCAHDL